MNISNEFNITEKEYESLSNKVCDNSKIYKNCLNAFLFGGLICCIGQAFINLYYTMGLDKVASSTFSSMTLIFIASILTGIGYFDDIAKIAGAGTLVPITGFANAITAPALEFKTEGYILGIASKLFIISGPVITYGVSSSVIYGFIYYLLNM